MALIAYLNHEDVTRILVQSLLQTREIGFTAASGYEELIIKSEAGSFYHFPSLERLDDHAASVSSGAALVGFFPPSGMSSVTVQSAIEELLTLVGSGSLIGTGTAGKHAVWVSGSTIGNSSILSEASSKLLFNADTVANIYRLSSGILKTDGGFYVTGDGYVHGILSVDGQAVFNMQTVMGIGYIWNNASIDQEYAVLINPTLTKNNSNTRQFYNIHVIPTFNAGGSNANTIFDIINVDSVNTNVTGLTVNLMKLSYGGSQRLKLSSNGDLSISPDGTRISFSLDSLGTMIRESNDGIFSEYKSAGTGRCEEQFLKSLGSVASPSDVSTSEIIHIEYSMAYSGGAYREGAKMQTVVDGSFTTGQNPPQRYEFYTAKANAADTLRLAIMSNGNLGFHTIAEFGSGERVLGIQNCITPPSTSPASGGVLYSESGALKWKGSSGTVTTIANA